MSAACLVIERLEGWDFVGHIGVMTAIVATLVFLPVGLLLALACVLLLGLSPHAVLSFGGAMSEPLGAIAWWLGSLVPAGVYSVWCLRG
jgi:hypothetical protein